VEQQRSCREQRSLQASRRCSDGLLSPLPLLGHGRPLRRLLRHVPLRQLAVASRI
jgi:hypothetical protein